jgi:uncharacterized membrane protein YjfL (UPF0719 family)
MLLLTKLAALGVVIWFYMSAEKNGQPAVKWAVIGLVGYIITWFLVDFSLDTALSAITAKNRGAAFIIGQVPAFVGLLAAHFIRKKLVSNIGKAN